MAAPMEMICGTILSYSRKNTRNCSRFKLVRAVDACQKCISAYGANCHRQLYAATSIEKTRTEFCSSKIKKGDNPFYCDRANYMQKKVISGTYLTLKRYSNCNFSANDREVNKVAVVSIANHPIFIPHPIF